MSSEISIIIPTLNEEDVLAKTLHNLTLLNPSPFEILLVDGGSQDNTLKIAREAGVTVFVSDKPGRSIQMNLGAKMAKGDLLCFLHADTLVPNDLTTIIDKVLADPAIAGGGFISLMTTSNQRTRWSVSLHNYLKTYYTPLIFRPHLFFKGLRILFGDQVIFCRRSDFWHCGGFDTLPIMEDVDLCIKLCRYGKIRLVNRIVRSSDRRVAKWGWLKANAIYIYIGFLWGIGVSADYLKQFYEDVR